VQHDAERPSWHYAVFGAGFTAAIVALRQLVAIRGFIDGTTPAWVVPAALSAGAALGACGGFTYGLVGRRLRAKGRIGPYAAGIVTVAGYMLPVAFVGPFVWDELPPDTPAAAVIAAFLLTVLFFGALLGFFLARGGSRAA
jgi:hypothetical protein